MAVDRRRGDFDRAAQTTGVAGASSKPKPRRHWRLAIFAAGLVAVVGLLPTIIVNTPLLHWMLGKATADLHGTVTVQSVSLGWFSPIAVRGVEVKDSQGRPIFTLASVSGDRTLAAILCNYTNLGRFRLERPQLAVVLRDDGSNVEDLLAQYLAPTKAAEPQKPSPKIGLALEIVDGSLSVADQNTGLIWRVDKLGAALEMPGGAEGPMAMSLSADLPDARLPGKLSVGMKMTATANEATLSAAQVPLAMVRPLLARLMPGTKIAGLLSSEVRASWGGAAGTNSVQAEVRAEGFALSAPMLQSDVVQLDRFHALGRASWQADRVEIEQAAIDCDVGNVSLESTVRLGEKGGLALGSLLRQRHAINAHVDLARLARLLPATLHIRPQMQINSGQLTCAFNSQPEQQGMAWEGQLSAANITATAAGRQVAWERPIALALKAHETPAGPFVDTLSCESDFLKIHASGTPDALAGSFSFNLKQLSDQLGQFVDFGAVQLAGEGWGNLNWNRSPPPQFAADTEVHLRNFQVALPELPPWREENLVATVSAKGQTNFDVETQIDTASLGITTGSDRLDVQLLQPVKSLQGGGMWPVRVRMQGQLQNWPGRLAAWLPTKTLRLSGAYAMESECTASADRVELRGARLAAEPLIVASPMLNVNEPRVDLAVNGSWDQQRRRLQLEPASLSCATVAVQANNVVLAMPEAAPMELGGTLAYQGDVARLRQWLSDPLKPPAWQLAGQLRGQAQFHQASGVIHGETAAELSNLAVVDATGQQFQEPGIRLKVRGDYTPQTGVIQLEQCELTSDALAANVAGRVAPASGENNAQLNAQLNYDLERLSGLLRPYLGPSVLIAGQGSSVAAYRGPFSLATGQANATLRWDWANLYGFQAGPGELKAAMADGAVQIEPLDLAVNRGRMHLAPRLRLTPDPMELTLPAGPLARQIQIDPAICGSLLKYAAPVLAGVTSAQGSFSVELDRCRLPVSDPSHGDLAGRFIIHSVEIGPGPLLRELAVLLGRESPAKLRQESIVKFHMENGRVHHENLELMFPELTIRTSGSVGFDQTLQITAEMPVPPKWTAINPTLAQAMQGQMIRVPIAGTLNKPQLDPREMENLNRRFLHKATERVIEGELNKQLNRLFGQ